ncbi:MAG: arginine--tRNA ligase [Bacteroidetes bacterium]|nr:arginine--tRNA ligase [Bacteroidota bacterium]
MFQDRLRAILAPAVQAAFNDCFGRSPDAGSIGFQPTRPEFGGDTTINVFPFLKLSGKGPEQTAQAVGGHLVKHVAEVAGFNVVKGFLNIEISDAYWLGFLKEADGKDILTFSPTGKQVMVEFASPNTNKPLHLGHLRNIFLGWSVGRILEAAGNEVVKVQVVNDRGIHICKSMVAWRMYGNGETPATSGLKGDKLVGKYYVAFDKAYKAEVTGLVAAGEPQAEAEKKAPILLDAQDMLRRWEANDSDVRALWAEMNGWVYDGFNATYARAGVGFDKSYYESNTYLLGKEDVLKGLEKGVFFRKPDGSVWVDNTADGLDEKVLLRADGTSLYITQDIGTAIQRFEEFPGLSRMIYTVGNEQDYHFKVLFIILKKLGFSWANELFHLSYGMVDLPSGKMKSREGTVVDADDLMDDMVAEARSTGEQLSKLDDFGETEKAALFTMIGMAALKYFLLKVDPKKRMLFDPKASIDLQGHTGPFIQYTYARIRSLVRKAAEMPGQRGQLTTDNYQLLAEEKAVLKLLHQFPAVLHEAASKLEPYLVANHAYDLVKAYNTFYQTVPVLKEADVERRTFRLALSSTVAATVAKAMWCLGIEAPERM